MDPHAAFPHEPAPPEPRHLLPPVPLLIRGLALGAVSLAAMAGLRISVRHSLLLASLSVPFAAIAVLAAWAAAIHLTGGEKRDDHPWV